MVEPGQGRGVLLEARAQLLQRFGIQIGLWQQFLDQDRLVGLDIPAAVTPLQRPDIEHAGRRDTVR